MDNNIPIKELKVSSQLLVMNDWRFEIPHEQRNIIIADALNRCVIDKSFHINGYLITNRRVFLIGLSKTTSFDEVLNHFYYQVELGILAYKKTIHPHEKDHFLKANSYHRLFTKFPFYNDHIRSLITGKEVKLNYYDPNLARLKAYIHHHNYCSAIDYADDTENDIHPCDDINTEIVDGRSPVIVHKLKKIKI